MEGDVEILCIAFCLLRSNVFLLISGCYMISVKMVR